MRGLQPPHTHIVLFLLLSAFNTRHMHWLPLWCKDETLEKKPKTKEKEERRRLQARTATIASCDGTHFVRGLAVEPAHEPLENMVCVA